MKLYYLSRISLGGAVPTRQTDSSIPLVTHLFSGMDVFDVLYLKLSIHDYSLTAGTYMVQVQRYFNKKWYITPYNLSFALWFC